VDETLTHWIAGRRWFSGKGRVPELTEIGRWSPASAEDGVRIDVLLLQESGPGGALYQVPLVTRGERAADREPVTESADGFLYDGTADPAFVRALAALVLDGGTAEGSGARAVGEPVGGSGLRATTSRVLSGEQSNTSIIVDTVDASGAPSAPFIVKLFRALHPGDNPDVVLQTAIAAAGSDRVPRSLGAVRGEWGEGAQGHLAFAQEFLSGTQDAWRVATAAVDADEDFTDRARALGEATAEVHQVLASAMPTVPADPDRRTAVLASMRSRYAAAAEVVPELAERKSAVEAAFTAAVEEDWPELQRVHGDYHLGQVLLVPDRGWVLLDFEGEPLRPMEERSVPDLALRDVAGMLRSFDYAAGASRAGDPSPEHASATERWAADARAAFLEGYETRSGGPLAQHRRLLAALELDKALYEAVYEARNRPDWLPIPAAAIERLTSLTE